MGKPQNVLHTAIPAETRRRPGNPDVQYLLGMELRGKCYHHRHTLTNYELFFVDTAHSVAAPKETQNEN